MTGERLLAAALAALPVAGCLEWEAPSDAAAGEAEVPALHVVEPASTGPVEAFDPGDLAGRCRIACRRYEECFGPRIDPAACRSTCTSEAWLEDAGDLSCVLWSGCTEIWLCLR
jgi:hypothetical protein